MQSRPLSSPSSTSFSPESRGNRSNFIRNVNQYQQRVNPRSKNNVKGRKTGNGGIPAAELFECSRGGLTRRAQKEQRARKRSNGTSECNAKMRAAGLNNGASPRYGENVSPDTYRLRRAEIDAATPVFCDAADIAGGWGMSSSYAKMSNSFGQGSANVENDSSCFAAHSHAPPRRVDDNDQHDAASYRKRGGTATSTSPQTRPDGVADGQYNTADLHQSLHNANGFASGYKGDQRTIPVLHVMQENCENSPSLSGQRPPNAYHTQHSAETLRTPASPQTTRSRISAPPPEEANNRDKMYSPSANHNTTKPPPALHLPLPMPGAWADSPVYNRPWSASPSPLRRHRARTVEECRRWPGAAPNSAVKRLTVRGDSPHSVEQLAARGREAPTPDERNADDCRPRTTFAPTRGGGYEYGTSSLPPDRSHYSLHQNPPSLLCMRPLSPPWSVRPNDSCGAVQFCLPTSARSVDNSNLVHTPQYDHTARRIVKQKEDHNSNMLMPTELPVLDWHGGQPLAYPVPDFQGQQRQVRELDEDSWRGRQGGENSYTQSVNLINNLLTQTAENQNSFAKSIYNYDNTKRRTTSVLSGSFSKTQNRNTSSPIAGINTSTSVSPPLPPAGRGITMPPWHRAPPPMPALLPGSPLLRSPPSSEVSFAFPRQSGGQPNSNFQPHKLPNKSLVDPPPLSRPLLLTTVVSPGINADTPTSKNKNILCQRFGRKIVTPLNFNTDMSMMLTGTDRNDVNLDEKMPSSMNIPTPSMTRPVDLGSPFGGTRPFETRFDSRGQKGSPVASRFTSAAKNSYSNWSSPQPPLMDSRTSTNAEPEVVLQPPALRVAPRQTVGEEFSAASARTSPLSCSFPNSWAHAPSTNNMKALPRNFPALKSTHSFEATSLDFHFPSARPLVLPGPRGRDLQEISNFGSRGEGGGMITPTRPHSALGGRANSFGTINNNKANSSCISFSTMPPFPASCNATFRTAAPPLPSVSPAQPRELQKLDGSLGDSKATSLLGDYTRLIVAPNNHGGVSLPTNSLRRVKDLDATPQWHERGLALLGRGWHNE
ncbi:unnamed protein product [Amoebophrya sp. A25]|nr:unnamed protein product [Amoebophrya sp. A25]|eukprot:GSA25T00022660001.1